ncbi:asparaginase [Glutamicibacter sp.]|uniref:asparaginase n=1 Tax=Glutamicibacter sp. TaxID=1931995 RepID=UPI0028BDE713|nr:asparaginase [Glutamicibacter sp.]
MKQNPPQPLPQHVPLVAATRGDAIESIHYGSAVVLGADGKILRSLGDAQAAFYPRSALKPLFAVGMLRAGLELDDEQLALASASHSGAQRHQDVALTTLAAAGLSAADLGNSTDLPYGVAERAAYLAAGGTPTQLAQNCSGKHAALVALSKLKGWNTADYLHDENLLQLLQETVEELCGEKISGVSTDGCGTPVYRLTLAGLARGFARLAAAPAGTPEARVAAAMAAYPELVAGEGRDVTELMRAVPGSVAKDGFEGIQAVALSDGTALAVKIADGGDRARMPITAALLSEHVAVPEELLSSPALGGGQPVGTLAAL